MTVALSRTGGVMLDEAVHILRNLPGNALENHLGEG